MVESLSVYLDQNNKTTTAAGYYIQQLRDALNATGPDVKLVDEMGVADVIHYNDLNLLAGIVSGKESRREHVRVLIDSICQHRDTPVVVTDHGNIHMTDAKEFAYGSSLDIGGMLSAFVRGTKRAFAPLVDEIIAVSETHKQSLIKLGLDGEKIHPVHHGVGEQYKNISETDTENPFVLHVSNYGGKKNPKAIFEVANRLDYRMVIAGGGWKERAPDQIQEDKSVEVVGYVPEEQLIELYNRASAFYLPTLYESFGIPLVEAMNCGTAVVTTDVHAVPEVTGGGAVNCPPHDVNRHVAELERILEDKECRTEFEERGLERSKPFTWERTARKTAEVYREALK
jgi:glycosyltransferase involved in cell wall biosynthesis